jgi:hypothetical protein
MPGILSPHNSILDLCQHWGIQRVRERLRGPPHEMGLIFDSSLEDPIFTKKEINDYHLRLVENSAELMGCAGSIHLGKGYNP